MKRRQAGLGLVEALLALAVSALLLAGASRLFVSAHQAWGVQGAAARLQDDARLALQRIVEDVRMAGMFGCLRIEPANIPDPSAAQAFAQPITITDDSLTLVGAELPGLLGPADWTVLTDCLSWARVLGSKHMQGESLQAFPVRRLTYRVSEGQLMLTTASQNSSLIDNVKALRVSRVQVGEGERLDIQLTLHEPRYQLEQHHQVSVALRNPAGGA